LGGDLQVGDWINTVSVIIAAGSFIWGVRAWRSSYMGQKRIELAEEVHGLFLTCADHISNIRNPVGYAGEGTTRNRAKNETSEESEIYDRAHVAIERFEVVKADFFKLFALASRFDLYFGKGSSAPIRTLRDVIQEIQSASHLLRRYWLRQGKVFPNEAAFEKHLTQMHKAEGVIWQDAEDDDAIVPRVNQAVTEIEQICRHSIDPQPNLWRSIKSGMLWVERFLALQKQSNG